MAAEKHACAHSDRVSADLAISSEREVAMYSEIRSCDTVNTYTHRLRLERQTKKIERLRVIAGCSALPVSHILTNFSTIHHNI